MGDGKDQWYKQKNKNRILYGVEDNMKCNKDEGKIFFFQGLSSGWR